tara:strand:- start:156 stop:494 length:339 start_codon:yes stop_codon:yes gene_type:complete
MKKLIFIFLLGIVGCGPEGKNHSFFYYDLDMKIVSINSDDALVRQGKYTKVLTCNNILFQTLDKDTLYVSMNTCKNGIYSINDSWVYSHKPGNIVHFEYLRKDRFFKIKNEN